MIRAKRKASGVAHDVGGVTLSIAPNGLFTRTEALRVGAITHSRCVFRFEFQWRHMDAPRGRRRVPARLQGGAGGDRLKAARFALPVGAFPRLAEVQEAVSTGGES